MQRPVHVLPQEPTASTDCWTSDTLFLEKKQSTNFGVSPSPRWFSPSDPLTKKVRPNLPELGGGRESRTTKLNSSSCTFTSTRKKRTGHAQKIKKKNSYLVLFCRRRGAATRIKIKPNKYGVLVAGIRNEEKEQDNDPSDQKQHQINQKAVQV